jgi:hypothetical protein
MESLRINEKNKLITEIKSIEISIKRKQETIERLKGLENSTFNTNQIEKIKLQLTNDNTKILEWKDVLTKIASGEYDEHLLGTSKKANNEISKKNDISVKKREEKQEMKKKDNEILQRHYNQNSRKNEMNEMFWEREEKKFYKNLNSIPQWILDKLRDMPDNKGYIWRNVWCFGKKNTTNFKNHITMFENMKGGVMRIIEIDDTYSKVYEKASKTSQKRLVTSVKRNNFMNSK